jgi:hypothetical protein
MAKFKLEDGTEIEAFTAEEVDAKITEQTSGLKAKVEELLGEKKSVSQKAKELEEAQAAAEEARLKEKEEYQTLYQREQESKKQLAERLAEIEKRSKESDISASTGSISTQLTKDVKRAKLLAEKAKEFAKHTGEGVIYEIGGVSVDPDKVIEHLKTEYPFLVDGSGMTGGGATGAGSGAATNVNARAEAAKGKGDLNGFLQAHIETAT